MWRLLKLIFTVAVVFGGVFAGVFFVNANSGMVNVQFPVVARETGDVATGIALLGAMAVGMGIAMILAFITSIGMTLHAQRLKREIKALRREVDALRNLPLLEDELSQGSDSDEFEDVLETERAIDVASGPVRGGSTVAPVGGDDDEELRDEDDDEDEDDEDAAESVSSTRLTAGTRKIDVP